MRRECVRTSLQCSSCRASHLASACLHSSIDASSVFCRIAAWSLAVASPASAAAKASLLLAATSPLADVDGVGLAADCDSRTHAKERIRTTMVTKPATVAIMAQR